MTHARKQIISYLSQLLDAEVDRYTVFDLDGGMSVELPEEEVDAERSALMREMRVARIEVVCNAKSADRRRAEDQLNGLAVVIERALASEASDGGCGTHQIGDGSVVLEYEGTSFERSDELEADVSQMRLAYSASYTVAPGRPDTLI